MLSYRLGTVNDFHWEFKPVLSSSIYITLKQTSHFLNIFGEEREKHNAFTLSNQAT